MRTFGAINAGILSGVFGFGTFSSLIKFRWILWIDRLYYNVCNSNFMRCDKV